MVLEKSMLLPSALLVIPKRVYSILNAPSIAWRRAFPLAAKSTLPPSP